MKGLTQLLKATVMYRMSSTRAGTYTEVCYRLMCSGSASVWCDKCKKQAGAELGQAQLRYTLALYAWLTLAVMLNESSEIKLIR